MYDLGVKDSNMEYKNKNEKIKITEKKSFKYNSNSSLD